MICMLPSCPRTRLQTAHPHQYLVPVEIVWLSPRLLVLLHNWWTEGRQSEQVWNNQATGGNLLRDEDKCASRLGLPGATQSKPELIKLLLFFPWCFVEGNFNVTIKTMLTFEPRKGITWVSCRLLKGASINKNLALWTELNENPRRKIFRTKRVNILKFNTQAYQNQNVHF